MADDMTALREMLEKGSDTTFLREIIGIAAQRLMELEVGGGDRRDGGTHRAAAAPVTRRFPARRAG